MAVLNRTTYRGTAQPVLNNSGGAIALGDLLSVTGYDTNARALTITRALANGTGLRAHFVAVRAIANGAMGYAAENVLVEELNTTGFAPFTFLSATVPGAPQIAAPVAAGQDVQRVGRVLTVHATLGRVLYDLRGEGLSIGPDEITGSMLAVKPYHDIGRTSVWWIRFTGVAVDGERITVDGRIYEFDTAAPPGVLGVGANVRVGVSGGGGDQVNNAAGQATAFAAAVNADAAREVDAMVDNSGTLVFVVGRIASVVANYVMASTVTGAFVRAVNMVGGAVPVTKQRLQGQYTFVAADVTTLAIALGANEIILAVMPSTTQPVLVNAQGRLTAANGVQSLDGTTLRIAQINANYWALIYREPAGGALFAAGDLLNYELIIP